MHRHNLDDGRAMRRASIICAEAQSNPPTDVAERRMRRRAETAEHKAETAERKERKERKGTVTPY